MPAGLIDVFLLAYEMMDEGRTEFTAEERARVEFSRYRCFLLGLPEDLLMDTPQGIVDIMNARNSTLRAGFEDDTCGALIRATLSAYLPPDQSWQNRLFDSLEKRFARIVFLKHFLRGDKARSKQMGIEISWKDYAVFSAIAPTIALRLVTYKAAMQVPGLRQIVDRHLIRQVRKLLTRYGHAEFTTDAEAYRPAHAAG